MRYAWEFFGVAVLGALAYSLVPETTYVKCDFISEGGETSEQFFELESINYPWRVFLGHDAILTGGAIPIPSYIELTRASGVGYIRSDDKAPSIYLFSLSGLVFLKIQDETFEGNCHRIEAVFP